MKRVFHIASIASLFATAARAQTTERVSVSTFGAQGSQGSNLWPGKVTPTSADGRFVVFSSAAPNLVHGDTNGREDVFLRDRSSGNTSRVSVNSAFLQANDVSTLPSISADGRFVVFHSRAGNLVAGDTNGVSDVFVRDVQSGNTARASISSDETQANDTSESAWISSDGRWIAFQSHATNLVLGDTNGVADIFLRHRTVGTTSRVSVSSTGAQASAASLYPSTSADGRYVAFASAAHDLVSGDTNTISDVFVRDRQAETTTRVSVDAIGAQGNDASTVCVISADGRFVAFESAASNLVPNDTNHASDIFVRDLVNGGTTRVSVSSSGVQSDGPSLEPALSADGRYVAFASNGTNLVTGDTNVAKDVFLHDRQTGQTIRISEDTAGLAGNTDSYAPSLSPDARYVAYESTATNLVLGDTNVVEDVFLHDRVGALPFTPFCFGDGSLATACPCSAPNSVPNPSGAPGRGCANSFNPQGALLYGEGQPSPDTVFLKAEIGTGYVGFGFLVKGDTQSSTGFANGDGVRCVEGSLVRFGGHNAGTNGALAGAWSYPNGAQTMSVSAVTGQTAGQSAYYQLFYRNSTPGFCSSATTNWSNSVGVAWP
ncbi:MAG: TolB family protein [Planctomycetota bacterium]